MNTQDKINRFAVDPNKRASYKARRFLRILTGDVVPVYITYKDLNHRVGTYSKEKIAIARKQFRNAKRATKYQVALLTELGVTNARVWLRGPAEQYISDSKQLPSYAAAKAKLRGYTYAH